jgi:Putative MetA-pathway of phenol degradation
MNPYRVLAPLTVALMVAGAAHAQQRPLVTEDPETVGAGRILLELGAEYAHDKNYPVSGLTGNVLSVPDIGISFGVSSIAEVQIDGSPYTRMSITKRERAPLSDKVVAKGDSTDGVEDIVLGIKLRLVPETETRPSFGLRFATKLPNSSTESGLEPDTTDFYATVLAGKTAKSTRYVFNVGLAILGDPTQGDRQSDLFTFGLSLAHAVRPGFELVAEGNGRVHFSSGPADANGENHTVFRAGARYTFGAGRIDAAVLFGAAPSDPNVGFTVGYTHVFNAFTVP